MTTNPVEVVLTDRGSARVQRALAAISIAASVAGGVVVAFSDQAWWAIVLWELGLLVVVFGMLALWTTASDDADQTAALREAGTLVRGEVTDKTVFDVSDAIMYELTLRIPVPGGGFEDRHRCSRSECTAVLTGGQVTVLLDATTRTWAVVH
ncbi:hypothetical protein [Lentzea sp. NBRC 102530]|uniref:hypothetical protein n=1 Tax=Lentzea sp. NBRC 102530 TaxID=3032201 RepID=UPI0024A31690|nr:hypothetical protein [Lentzea sp. NBRC 102530]GLY47241.1 hypothetical protein Lesp01_08970 [Lentzea sp. NBRC 102530]